MADKPSGHAAKAERAIAALLREESIEAAAAATGIGSRTIHRWLLKDEAFQRAYRLAKRQVVEQAQAQIQRATGKAVKVLVSIMEDEVMPPSARVTAARAVLEMAFRAVEIDDLETRIQALEAVQKAGVNGASTAWH